MEQTAALEFCVFVVVMSGLVYFFYGPWQELWTDWVRQRLFEVRHELFMLAAEGKIAFDDPQYRELRKSLEGLIRFSHNMTWTRLVIFQVAAPVRLTNKPLIAERIEAIQDRDARERVNRIFEKMGPKIAFAMIMRAPLLLLILGIPAFLGAIMGLLDEVIRLIYRVVLEDSRRDDHSDNDGGLVRA